MSVNLSRNAAELKMNSKGSKMLGTIQTTNAAWNRVNVVLINYRSVPAIRYEPVHSRLLLWTVKGHPFWSPPCWISPCSRVSDHRLIGSIVTDLVIPKTWTTIVNMAVVDYTRYEMTKILDFIPFELQAGHPFRFQYQFLLRGKDGRRETPEDDDC